MNGLVGGLCVCNEKQRNYTAKMCTANSPDAVPLSGAEHCRAKWVNYSHAIRCGAGAVDLQPMA